MKYYKVKPEYDNKTRYKWRCGHGVSDGILIANELYTEKEYQKLANYSGCFEKIIHISSLELGFRNKRRLKKDESVFKNTKKNQCNSC